jgi:ABC-type nickel/cobalt efflux system permease component RcnA
MRKTFLIAGLGIALLIAVLAAMGRLEGLGDWATASQRAVQDQLAGAVRALRGGQPGALAALLGVAFAYGFFHAVGPGHGKVLIGGYAVARRVRLLPLAMLALVSALAQASVAVLLVYVFVLAFGWTRDRVEGMADVVLMPMSQAIIALIGLWLVWRGLKGVRMAAVPALDAQSGNHSAGRDDGHLHDHAHPASSGPPVAHVQGASCNHAHGPTLADMGRIHSFRDAALLVAAIAVRPCSGALFLLIITWTVGIAGAGIAGVYAMALGTALVTVGVAALSVWAREGAFATLSGAAVSRAVPIMELVAGAAIVLLAASMLAAGV